MSNCDSSNACSNKSGGIFGASTQKLNPVTIGEHLDRRIATARKNVEDLCVAKAKLEALNVLNHPIDLYQEMLF